MVLLSGVDEFVLLLFGVEFEDGFAVLFGFDEFMSVLLELGDVVLVVELELELGAVEFMSVLLVDDEEEDGVDEVVSVLEDGDVDVLEPVWLDWVDGVL